MKVFNICCFVSFISFVSCSQAYEEVEEHWKWSLLEELRKLRRDCDHRLAAFSESVSTSLITTCLDDFKGTQSKVLEGVNAVKYLCLFMENRLFKRTYQWLNYNTKEQ